MARHQRFTIFKDDDVTPLIGTVDGSGNVTVPSASTDSAVVRPYMIRTTQVGESTIDPIEGSGMVGQATIQVLDKRTVATDQTTGWFTALLAGTNGQNQMIGCRLLFEQQNSAGGWYTVLDGVIGDISLDPSYVSYSLDVRDMRDRARKTRIFTKSTGISVYPRGFVNGYGNFGGNTTGFTVAYPMLQQPVVPAKAVFRLDPNGGGLIGLAVLDPSAPTIAYDYVAELRAVTAVSQNFKLATTPTYVQRARGSIGTLVSLAYSNIRMRWSPRGTNTWTVLADMPYIAGTKFSSSFSAYNYGLQTAGFAKFNLANISDSSFVLSSSSSANLPTDGQAIDIICEYYGVPTENYPLYIERPLGDLLKAIYDGDYSDEPTRIRYNTTTMAAFQLKSPPGRVKITEPKDDPRAWTEDSIYKPCGYCPSIDAQGKISPVSIAIPDATVTPFTLNDSNIVHGKASWIHSSQRIANKVIFKYVREYAVPPSTTTDANASGIAEREVEFVDIHGSVISLGEFKVEYDPGTIRAIGSPNGFPITGQVSDETGPKLMQQAAANLFDRFAYGVQEMKVSAQRRDASVSAAVVGDWAYVASSWMPDYVTGKRGINRIAQIISIDDSDPAMRTFVLLDGGPNSAPVALPTIGALSVSGLSVSIPISAIAAGLFAEVQYAIASAQPVANSGAWMFVGRLDTAGSIITPTVPAGQTVWVRTRGVGENRRPSAWSNAVSITTPLDPQVVDAMITLQDGSDPILTWHNVTGTAGLRIKYAVYADGAAIPAFSTYGDVSSTTGTVTLTGVTVKQYQRIMISLQGFSAFSGGVASGSSGSPTVISAARLSPDTVMPFMREVPSETATTGTLVLIPNDPQYRVSLVEFRTYSGLTLAQDWTAVGISGGQYTQTVPLVEKQPSRIEWRMSGYTTVSTAAQLIDQGAVRFAIGGKPVQPEVSYQIDDSGILTVVANGDSSTTGNRIIVTPDYPTDAAIDAGTYIAGRSSSVTGIQLVVGQNFYVGVKSYNTALGGTVNSQGSAAVVQKDQWIGPSASKATISVASVSLSSNTVTLNSVTLGAQATHFDVFVRESRSDPGAAVSVAQTGYRLGPTRTVGGNITIPIANPQNYVLVTLVAVDALNRVGNGTAFTTGQAQGTVALKIQAAASTSVPPDAPVTLTNSVTGQSVTLSITMPASNLPTTLRIRRGGTAIIDIAGGAANAVVTYTDSGLAPSSSYTYDVLGVSSGGISGPSPSTTATTGAATIPNPTGVSSSGWNTTSRGFDIVITPAGGTPSGVTWFLQHSIDGGASWPDAMNTQATSFFHAHNTDGTPHSHNIRVMGVLAGYASTAWVYDGGGTTPTGNNNPIPDIWL